jgi:peptidoglycan/xylan/chitin deacetylase (PgdA/CDA1 family)
MMSAVLGSSLMVAAGVMAYAVRGRSSTWLAPSVYRGPANRASVALTFDDGPSEFTPELLNVLERFGVSATFFQCGMHVRRLPAIARAVISGGHEIGNHTDTHPRLYLQRAAFIRQELDHAQESILEATGVVPTLFRAPYGVRWLGLREAQAQLGLLGVMWTTLGRDWTLPPEAIARRLLSGARNGAIFCLHDGREAQQRPDIRATIEAVREFLPRLLDRGFRFQTVSQLLCPTN